MHIAIDLQDLGSEVAPSFKLTEIIELQNGTLSVTYYMSLSDTKAELVLPSPLESHSGYRFVKSDLTSYHTTTTHQIHQNVVQNDKAIITKVQSHYTLNRVYCSRESVIARAMRILRHSVLIFRSVVVLVDVNNFSKFQIKQTKGLCTITP